MLPLKNKGKQVTWLNFTIKLGYIIMEKYFIRRFITMKIFYFAIFASNDYSVIQ